MVTSHKGAPGWELRKIMDEFHHDGHYCLGIAVTCSHCGEELHDFWYVVQHKAGWGHVLVKTGTYTTCHIRFKETWAGEL